MGIIVGGEDFRDRAAEAAMGEEVVEFAIGEERREEEADPIKEVDLIGEGGGQG